MEVEIKLQALKGSMYSEGKRFRDRVYSEIKSQKEQKH